MIYLTEYELFEKSNEFLHGYFFNRKYAIQGEPVVVVSVQHFSGGMMIAYRWKGERHISTVSEFLDKTSQDMPTLTLHKRRAPVSEQLLLNF